VRLLLGLSGGVDSSVAGELLRRQGHAVEALFMKNWEEDDADGVCTAAEDLADARAVAERLGLTLHTANFSADYWERVFEHFLAEYRAGRTPNPDVLCNREVKFKSFLERARDLGFSGIATGHYARVRERDGRFELLKGLDAAKDQSYFLHLLDQYQLSHAHFPVGELEKGEVRALARELGLVTHDKKDSTGVCFIGERNFREFLQRYLPAQPGEIQTPEGEVIGTHHGLMYYTIGQRSGLGIGGVKGYPDAPWFVAEKVLEHNILIAVQGGDHPLLCRGGLLTETPHWIAGTSPPLPLVCRAKTRYRQADQACRVEPHGEGLRVWFDEVQRAITPGQSVVFYAGEVCLGGAVIRAALGAPV